MAPILPKSMPTTEPVIIDKTQSNKIHKESQQRSSKCLVYALTSFVTLFALWLIFASIVLRVTDPKLKLRSARVMHISYSILPSSPSFNITMIATMTIMNPNFGHFDYGNGSVMSVVYGNVSVGVGEICGDTMEARENKEINVMVNVRSSKKLVSGNNNLTNQIHSGTLELRNYAKLSGTVNLLKIVKKKKTIEMDCIMNLNLTAHSVHHIQC
ncbi:hypothetical protein RIF29_37474 [Crotalaria pallida]|uniref:Late embryogenesis abundant protein LEA-2 subgroup domain-containing protein n=1 Tax=Crotalaria pallida TaxID=3830 RepID=A0AAN9ECJ8_CROPI